MISQPLTTTFKRWNGDAEATCSRGSWSAADSLSHVFPVVFNEVLESLFVFSPPFVLSPFLLVGLAFFAQGGLEMF